MGLPAAPTRARRLRPSRPRVPRPAALAVVAAALVSLVVGPSTSAPAGADVGGEDLVRGGIEVGDSLDFYDYADATDARVPSDTDWAAGTYLDTTSTDDPGALTLARDGAGAVDPGEPWWDTSWRSRRCVDVDHRAAGASTVTEYQVRVVLNTQTPIAAGELAADGSDLRVVRHDGVGFLPLDFWVDASTLNTLSTVIWVQVDQITAGAGTDFCLYWNNAAPVTTASDLDAAFTYATRKPLYYTVSETYTGAATSVAVSPYVNATSIAQNASVPVTANNAQVLTFTGNNSNTVYHSTGPLAALGTANAQDMLVPAAFAGTDFVVPTNRNTQRWYVRSPWATTIVQFYDGSTPVGSPVTVTPAAGTVGVTADVTGTRTGIVRSTNGVPFLLTHAATSGSDAVIAYPSTTDNLYGTHSQRHYLGYATTGSNATVQRSDGTQATVTGAGPDARSDFGAAGSQGTGPAVVVSGLNNRVGSVQQADGDGTETTALWPGRELSSRYLLPVSSQYVAVACPVAGTQISFAGAAPVACSGATFGSTFIGKARDGTARTVGATAISVTSAGGQPFQLYYERSGGSGADDEVQVGSFLQGRQFTYPTPALSVRAEEGIATYRPSGTWDSSPYDTGAGGVFGLLRWSATTPAGTTVRFQVASGDTQLASVLAAFVGPDGTSGTWYTTSPTPAAYGHDGDRWVRLRAVLATTDPSVTPRVGSITLGTRLATFASSVDAPTDVAVSSPAGVPTRRWIARVRTTGANLAGATSTLRSAGAPVIVGLGSAVIGFHRPDADEVVVSGGTVTQPVGAPVAFSAGAPHSIVLDATTTGPATLDMTWSTILAGGSPVIEHRFRFALSG